jgi:hypothetical protein
MSVWISTTSALQVLASAKKRSSFEHLVMRKASEPADGPRWLLAVGVDMRYALPNTQDIRLTMNSYIWTKCKTVSTAGIHNNPELIFFYKLADWRRLGMIFIFVFDGPNRPAVKRGHNVVTAPIATSLKPLIQAFGFHVHDVSQIIVSSYYVLILS